MRALLVVLALACGVAQAQEARLDLAYSAEAKAGVAARFGFPTRSTEGVADPRYRIDLKAGWGRYAAALRAQSARPPEERLPGDGGDARTLEPRLAEAWLGVEDLELGGSWSVRAGLQDLRYELRRTGEAFFLRLGESEGATAAYSVAGGAGARATWESEWLTQPVYVDVFWLEILEAENLRSRERVIGANLDWLFDGPSKELFRTVNLIAAYIDGERDAMTVGLGVDWIASRHLEAFGELYGQFGSEGTFAGRLGARRTWFHLVSEPYVEASVWYVGEGFLSFENVDTFRILEEDRVGLDVDENYWSLRLRSGLSLAAIAGGADLSLEARYGFFGAAERERGRSSRLGHEIDLELRWKPGLGLSRGSLELGAGAAVLLDSRHLEDRGGRREAGLLYLEAVFRY